MNVHQKPAEQQGQCPPYMQSPAPPSYPPQVSVFSVRLNDVGIIFLSCPTLHFILKSPLGQTNRVLRVKPSVIEQYPVFCVDNSSVKRYSG
jgi:hypothetical protein